MIFTPRTLGLLLLAAAPLLAQAQTDEKPSNFLAARRGGTMQPAAPQAARQGPAFLDRLDSRSDFDRLARIHGDGSAQATPHLIFAIDRSAGDRVYYIHSVRFPFHEDFLRAQHLVANLDHATLLGFYQKPNRRFVLGTLSLHPALGRWVYEFWDGDQATADHVALADRRLRDTFFAPLAFKANSTLHEASARQAGIAAITQQQLVSQRDYLPLNQGRAVGRLRLIDNLEGDTQDDIEPYDIVVLREVPLSLPPVAGVITVQPSTALSHVNLLAKGWGIPNAYVRDAYEALARHDGRWVRFEAGRDSYQLEATERPARLPTRKTAALIAKPDLSRLAPIPLVALKATDTSACGGKAARLGVLERLRLAGRLPGVAPVPDGFCLPFAQHAAFMAQPQAQALIRQALATERFDRSSRVRRQVLQQLRADLVELPLPAGLEEQWLQRWREQLAGSGVFVRSSSNSEDLANFSGAGLYSTVPNVRQAQDLSRAVKTVWASVFNAEAFEARRAAGLAHDQVRMAVFVQRAIDSRLSGVMITRDPFDAERNDSIYISAKRGIGIRVVEGRRIAEQSLYNSRNGAVQRFSRSAEDTELRLDEQGGVKEVPVERHAPVLSDADVRRLARIGQQVKRGLGKAEQDIEWAIDGEGRVVLLQARPYVQRSNL